ncbi:MAG: hypothetical protein CMF70_12780, partial [Magnetovibrio sp.]|nr:hypothetical protein [Magnetovibrio sp.]
GSTGDDTITGDAGDDYIDGGADDDSIDGGLGDDHVVGGAGDDTITAGEGDDTVHGSTGHDTITGDAGADTIEGGTGHDYIDGGSGADLIDGGADDDMIMAGEGDDTVQGSAGADTIAGDAGDDYIDGGADDDSIDGGLGDDHLVGGTGDDLIIAGVGDDVVHGGEGADNISGGVGDDMIDGGANDDYIIGGTGDDRIEGGPGSDTVEFDGNKGDFTFAVSVDGTLTVTDTTTDEGIDVISGVETLRFNDGDLAVETVLLSSLSDHVDQGTDTIEDIERLRFGDGTEVSISSAPGSEAQVNTYTSGEQSMPSVTALEDGGYVVAWRSSDNQDGNSWGVFSQRYDVNGDAVGDEVRVNTYTTSEQRDPSVTSLSDGGYVVTWMDSSGHDGGSGWDVRGQVYDAQGNAAGDEFRANTYASSSQYDPAVSGLADGGFVVTWRDDSGHSGGSSNDVRAQRFDSDGAMVGGEVRVNTYTSSSQYEPSIATLEDGGYVVTWRDESGHSGGSSNDVRAQRFDAEGTVVGDEMRVNSYTGNSQYQPSVTGLADGGYVITWRDNSGHSGGSGADIRAQRYDSESNTVGDEVRVNTYTSSSQYEPSVAALSNGGYVVTWRDDSGHSDGSSQDVRAQVYGSDGSKVGDEFMVNEYVSSTQYQPSVTGLADGGFAVTWASNSQDGSNYGIYTRRFDNDGAPTVDARLIGGIADEAIMLADGQTGVSVDLGAGDDSLILGNTRDTLSVENVETVSLGGGDDYLRVTGETAAVVDGGAGNDVLYGGLGDDELAGGAGDDVFVGGEGADTLIGGLGDDTYYVSSLEDTLVEQTGGGFDQVISSLETTTLSSNIEQLVLSGDAVEGTGNALDNSFLGNAADNVLHGGLGDDTLDGGAGVDIADFAGDAEGFTFDFSSQTVIDIDPSDAGGDEGTDTLINMETVRFGDGVTLTVSEEEQGQFQVNTATYHEQFNSAVTSFGNGNFVVTWMSYGAGEDSDYGIRGQLYGADGIGLGDEFQVNTWTGNNQQQASKDSVAELSDGGFVVTWMDTSGHDGGSGWDIRARRYDDTGSPVGDEFMVNTYTSSTQYNPVVTGLADGGFAVAWRDDSGHSGGSGYDVWTQRFDSAGTPAGDELRVNSHTGSSQYEPSITGLADGGYVVSWRDDSGHSDGSSQDVRAQVYGSEGPPVGGEFLVNTHVSSTQYQPSVTGLADGDFVVSWASNNQDGSNYGVYGQRYEADGTVIGDEFRVNTTTYHHQQNPDVTALADGGYVVTWESRYQDHSSSWGIYGQRYDATGSATGGEFLINNEHVSGDQNNPSVSALDDGGFVVTWQSSSGETGGSPSNRGVFAIRYDADGTPGELTTLLGSDGDDSFKFSGIGDYSSIDFGAGEDTVTFVGDSNDTFFVVDAETVHAGGGDDVVGIRGDGPITLFGDAGDDQLMGNAADNILFGGAGSDWISGGLGDDQLDGGLGADTIRAGDGDDVVMAGGDDDTVDGGAGDDALAGGAGNDLIDGGEGDDTAVFSGNMEDYRIETSADGIRVEDIAGDGGTDTLRDVETLQFADGELSVSRDDDGEVQVNTRASSTQFEPTVATFADGGYVIVWTSHGESGMTDTDYGIYGQHYDSLGQAAGDEFRINTGTYQSQEKPSVAVLEDGGYVVTWESYHTGEENWTEGIRGQRFNSSGEPLGGEFQVNTHTGSNQYDPSVASLADGGYVVAWRDDSGHSGGSGIDVRAQRFDSENNMVGDEVLVNSHTGSSQYEPSVTGLANGGYVVSWRDDSGHSDGSSHDVRAQVYDSAGAPAGGEFLVNTHVSNTQYGPSTVGLDDGSFVVTWSSRYQDYSSTYGVYGQRYEADGTPVGDEFQINTHTSSDQQDPSAAALSNGGFVVTWKDESGHSDGSSYDVRGQRFGADGVPAGDEFLVNTNVGDYQQRPAVSGLADGGYVVTWESRYQDGSDYGVYSQRYDADGVAISTFRLTGGAADDELLFSQPQSEMIVDLGDGNDSLGLGDQDDAIRVENVESVSLGGGDDVVSVEGETASVVDGGDGDDRMISGDGEDTLRGGAGDDTYVVNDAGDTVVENAGEGDADTVISTADSYTLADGVETLQLSGDAVSGTGNEEDNQIIGSDQDNILSGGGGDDVLDGGAGDDVATYSGAMDDYRVDLEASTITDVNTADGDDGTDTLSDIETLRFGDGGELGLATGAADDIPVNTWTSGTQDGSQVTVLADGRYVVTWQDSSTDNPSSTDSDTSGWGTYGQVFTDGGVALGEQFRVNTYTSSNQYDPSIAALADGGFVIVFRDSGGPEGGSGEDVRAQRYDAMGIEAGAEFRVNEHTSSSQYDAAVAALADGGYVVTWRDDSAHSGGSSADVRAQRYDSENNTVGGEFRVNEHTGNSQYDPSVAGLADGGYVISWRDDSAHSGGSGADVRAQRYDSENNTVGDEFRVNEHTGSSQTDPVVSALADGGYVITWRDDSGHSGGSGADVRAQRFDSANNTVGDEILVNTYVSGGQFDAAVTGLSDGGFIVTWTDDSGHSGGHYNDVRGQIYDSSGAPVGDELVLNTYTNQYQNQSAVAATADGGFIASWTDNAQEGSGYGVFSQRFNSDGTPAEAARLIGGAADETLAFDAAQDGLMVDLGDGIDTATFGDGDDAVALANVETAELGGGDDKAAVSGESPAHQTEIVTLSGTIETGDVYTVTVNGTTASYRAQDGDGAGEMQAGLIESLNGTGEIARIATAMPGENDNQILLRANQTGTMDEFQVNSQTGGSQYEPSMTALADGSYVVVWRDESSPSPGSGNDIRGQIYNPQGEAAGDEFLVNSHTGNHQYTPSVTALSDGGFAVAWRDDSGHSGGSGYDVRVRQFDADGVPAGDEARVNTYTSSNQYEPSITGLADGGYVVAWRDQSGHSGGSGEDVRAQRYDSDGQTVGDEVRVNSHTGNSQYEPSIAGLADGGYVITWRDNSGHSGGSGADIRAQRYDSESNTVGDEVLVNSHTGSSQYQPSVTGLADGGYVVTWRDDSGHSGGSSNDVRAQRYDSENNTVGDEVRVNSHMGSSQYEPSITGLADGGYVITWRDDSGHSGGSGADIRAQRFDSESNTVGDEFLVNSHTPSTQYAPSVTAVPDGGFAISWASNSQDGSGYGIFAQEYNADGTPSILVASADAVNVTQGLDDNALTVDDLNAATVAIHQVDRVEITGTVESGDVYTIAVNGHDASYTVQPGDSISSVRAGLIGAVNADPQTAGLVSAQAGTGGDALLLTATTAGVALATTLNAVNNGLVDDNGGTVSTLSSTSADVRQIATVNISGTVEAGDSYTVTVDGHSVSHTVAGGDSLAGIRDALIGDLNAIAEIGDVLSAFPGDGDSQIILRGHDVGAVFSATASSDNVIINGLDDNAASVERVLSGTDTAGARIDGGAGDDILYGGTGDDTLLGGTGGDILVGGAGDDTIDGGDGDDVLAGGRGDDRIGGGEGNDLVIFSGDLGDYTISVEDGALTVRPTAGDGEADTLYGIETLRFGDGDVAVSSDADNTYLTRLADGQVTTISSPVTATSLTVDEPGVLQQARPEGLVGGEAEDSAGAATDSAAEDSTDEDSTAGAGGESADPATYTAVTDDDGLTTVTGTDRADAVTFGDGDDRVSVSDVETVDLGAGDDDLTVVGVNKMNQVDTITLSGAVEDHYTVSVEGMEVTYATQPGDSLVDVRAGLIGAINADPAMGSMIAASGGEGEQLVLTNLSAGTPGAFQVNTESSNNQQHPSVTTLSDGNLVTTWQSYNQDGSNWGVYAQIMNRAGDKIGSEFQVNTYTSSAQQNPAVAALDGGGFIVTWTDSSAHSGGSNWDVRAQRFDNDGSTAGSEFMVNSHVGSEQSQAAVTALAGGGYVVTWGDSSGHSGGSGWDVRAQVYDGSNQTVGDEVRVNSHTGSSQYYPGVAALDDGGFVVTWQDNSAHSGGSGWDIRAQVYDASGEKADSEFLVNSHVGSSQQEPSVATLSDGSFVITWGDSSGHSGGSGWDIRAQRFDAEGTAIGDEVLVNTYTSSTQYESVVTALAGGGYAITWRDDSGREGSSNYDIRAQLLDADGNKMGDEILVNNEYTADRQSEPAITALDDGGFVVTWQSEGEDGSNYGIYAQRFGADGMPTAFSSSIEATAVAGSTSELVRISGTIETGDSYTISLDGQDYGYTAQPGDTLADVRLGLISAVNSSEGSAATASGGGAVDEILLTATLPGTAFSASASAASSAGGSADNVATTTTLKSETVTVDTFAGETTVSASLTTGPVIDGGDGDDILRGDTGADTLAGGAGDDTLIGGDGNDVATFAGNAEDYAIDLVDGNVRDAKAEQDDPAYVTITGSEVADDVTLVGPETAYPLGATLEGEGGDDVLTGGDGMDTIDGGDGNDIIDGSFGDDTISAGDGDDTVYGSGGDDDILGGDGDDQINAGAGDDHVSGNMGDDTVSGASGDDVLYGDAGSDTIDGGTGDDYIDGGADADVITGGDGDDIIEGGLAADTITAGDGDDEIGGGTGNDILAGGAGDDTVDGGEGDDLIDAGDGNDLVSGGQGWDTVYAGDGDDTVDGGDGNDYIGGDAGDDVIDGGAGADGIDGGTGDDTIYGQGGDDQIVGNEGDDYIVGGSGNDFIDGGAGDDRIVGSLGNDHIDGGAGSDFVDYSLDYMAGSDLGVFVDLSPVGDEFMVEQIGHAVDAYGGLDALSGIENVYGSALDDEIIGDSLGNIIMSDSGDDLIYGASGDDTIWSEAGDDTVYGDAGDDWISGGAGADALMGNEGADIIFGADGSDLIIDGGAGDDILGGGFHGALSESSPGAGDWTFTATAELSYLADGDDILEGGYGDDTFIAWFGDDVIRVGGNAVQDHHNAVNIWQGAVSDEATKLQSYQDASAAASSAQQSRDDAEGVQQQRQDEHSAANGSLDAAVNAHATALAADTAAQDTLTIAQGDAASAEAALSQAIAARDMAVDEFDAAESTDVTAQNALSDAQTVHSDAQVLLTTETAEKADAISEYDMAVSADANAQSALALAQANANSADTANSSAQASLSAAQNSASSAQATLDAKTSALSQAQAAYNDALANASTSSGWSFENGWGDWSYTGQASISQSSSIATDGSYYVNLNSQTTSLSSIASFLGVSSSDSALSGGKEGAAIKTTVDLPAGATVSFDWSFVNGEGSYNNSWKDFAFAAADGDAIFLVNTQTTTSGQNPWQTFSYTTTTSGSHTFGAGVMNYSDKAYESRLYVDNFEVSGGGGTSADVTAALNAFNSAQGEYDAALAQNTSAQNALSAAQTTASTAQSTNTAAQNALIAAQTSASDAQSLLATETSEKADAIGEFSAAETAYVNAQSALQVAQTNADVAQSLLAQKTADKEAAIGVFDLADTDNISAQGALSTAEDAAGSTQAELDTKTSERDAAQANHDNAYSNLVQAEADAEQREAEYNQAQFESDQEYISWQTAIDTSAAALDSVEHFEPLTHQTDTLLLPVEFSWTGAGIDLATDDLILSYDDQYNVTHTVTIEDHRIDPIDRITLDVDRDGTLETLAVAQEFTATLDAHTLIVGSSANDVLTGAAGDDWIVSSTGDDTIDGGAGQDMVEFTGSMADFTFAADAMGTLTITDTTTMEGTDVVFGVETLRFADGDLTVTTGEDGHVTLTGTGTVDDILVVGPQAMTLEGVAGNDILTGGDGDDVIDGALGDDTIDGGAGDDTIYGQEGADDITGGTGDDTITAGTGDDTVDGGAGVDVVLIDGDKGDFTFAVAADGALTVTDTRSSGGAGDTASILFVSDSGGSGGIATVLEGEGYDVTSVMDNFSGGSTPALSGDLSQYAAIYWQASGDGSGSTHTNAAMFSNLEAYVQGGGRVFVTGYDSIASPSDPQLISFVGGGSSQDTPGQPGVAIDAANSLTTGAVDIRGVVPAGGHGDTDELKSLGSDTIGVAPSTGGRTGYQWTLRSLGEGEIAYVSNGQSGTSASHASWTNTSSGGSGAYNAALRNFAQSAVPETEPLGIDVLSGVETLRFNDGDLTVTTAEDGYVTLTGTGVADDVLVVGSQAVTLEGVSGDDILTGGAGGDVIDGAAGDDVIEGGAGDDVIEGGTGDDMIDGGLGQDTVEFTGNKADFTFAADSMGTLTITDTTTMEGTDVISGVETLRFADGDLTVSTGEDGHVTLTGTGTVDDVLVVGPQAMTLEGVAGNDILTGGDGADTIDGALGDDTIDGGAGDDTIYGQEGADDISGGTGDDMIDGGLDNDMITAGAGDDTVYGSSGDDTIMGGAGDDTIDGGLGADLIDGGA